MSTRRRMKSNNTMASDSPTPPFDDYVMQTEEMNLLDKQEGDDKLKSIYTNNRIIFLMQSMLLGFSYSMVWPTMWLYVKNDLGIDQSSIWLKFAYGVTYVAYPVASMLSAHLVERIHLSTKAMILLLNLFEIVGSLVYTLHYYPFLPLVGRFISGLGDAFYVVLMKEMKDKYGQEGSEKMTIECLAAFIIGVIVAPGLNIVTTFMHFSLGTWHLNAGNYPGLTMAVLFLVMEFVIMIFLIGDMSTGSTPKSQPQRFIDYGNVVRQSTYKTVLIMVFSFCYTYIVAAFELLIPIILFEVIKTNSVGAMLLYAVIGTLYAMFLMITMTVSFKNQLEVFLSVAVIAEVVGLFTSLYFEEMYTVSVVAVVLLIVIVLCLTVLWSNDDLLFINFVQVMIPPQTREDTHNARKFVSKFAFAIAGITVPFWFSKAMFFVAPILICLVTLMLVIFLIIRISDKSKK